MSERDVLILGGGFAGAWAAMAAARAASAVPRRQRPSITLVTREPWLTVRPRLYERDPSAARVDLRPVLDRIGVGLEIGHVTDVDPASGSALVSGTARGRELRAAALVLATGSRLDRRRFPLAPGVHDIDTRESAVRFRRSLARSGRPSRVAVIGAGLAGVELATELAGEGHVVTVIDRRDDPGAEFGHDAWAVVRSALDRLGVELRSGASVTSASRTAVQVDDGAIVADHVVLTSGLVAATDFDGLTSPRDTSGRVEVDKTLAVIGAANVFAAGDAARIVLEGDRVSPMSCQMAIPTGVMAGANAVATITGGSLQRFEHHDYVTCVDLGPGDALFTRGWERRPELTGADAARLKQWIVTEAIVPDPATFDSGLLIA